jgi:hypothetical protein
VGKRACAADASTASSLSDSITSLSEGGTFTTASRGSGKHAGRSEEGLKLYNNISKTSRLQRSKPDERAQFEQKLRMAIQK